MIKLSVVVLVYNTEKYLKRCLDSILNQNLKEIEIIIVNDGSPDNSKYIIEEYQKKDSRIKVINKKNGGVSSSRNIGVEVSKGEYIIHIDSDDWIEKNYFKDMYEKAKKDDLDIVISDFYWDYDNGIIEKKIDLDISENKIIDGKKYKELFLKGKIFPAVWNKMYKLKLYTDYNIKYPINISMGEDLVTTPLLAQNAERIAKINKAYIHYIQNLESITKSNPTKKIYELISAFEILEKKLLNFNKQDLTIRKIVNIGTLVFNSSYNLNDSYYEEGLKYYSDLFKEEINLNNFGKKLRFYFSFLIRFPNVTTLKLILNFNRVASRIKKLVS